jgi:hypothetical protein
MYSRLDILVLHSITQKSHATSKHLSSSSRPSSPCAAHPSHLDPASYKTPLPPFRDSRLCCHNHRLYPGLPKLSKTRLHERLHHFGFYLSCGARIPYLLILRTSSSTPIQASLLHKHKYHLYVYISPLHPYLSLTTIDQRLISSTAYTHSTPPPFPSCAATSRAPPRPPPCPPPRPRFNPSLTRTPSPSSARATALTAARQRSF